MAVHPSPKIHPARRKEAHGLSATSARNLDGARQLGVERHRAPSDEVIADSYTVYQRVAPCIVR
jgi:hypothetical protein